MSVETDASTSEFTTGLCILLLAQLMSAFMGAYVEDTYARYNASWTENLFYSHILSLPLFLPLSSSLQRQYAKLATTAPLDLSRFATSPKQRLHLGRSFPEVVIDTLCELAESMPQSVFFLLVNSVTQLACISGVSLLSAKSSAVGVTIVLNIRKLVSFVLSTIIFGHSLSGTMVAGAALVFGSGALYGWETSWRLPQERRREERVKDRDEKGR